MDRRTLLGAGCAAFVGLPFTGCDVLSTSPSGKGGGGAEGGQEALEAPRLSELVADGKLPVLEQRLPERPRVVQPVEQVGRYGGTWTTATTGPTDSPWLGRCVDVETPLGWTYDIAELVPEVFEAVEHNADATEFVFRMRKGMKWSDGEPFTADDIVFAQNDVYNNTTVYPAPPDPKRKAEKVDDYTVRMVFERPAGLYMQTDLVYGSLVSWPKHYLTEFHLDYNDEANKLAEDEGSQSWSQLLLGRASVWENTELPTLNAWTLTTPYGAGSRVRCERNPYYYKTDTDGRQLPYLDEIVFEVASEEQVILLKAANGELNMHMRHINSSANKPVLARNREKAGYEFFDTTPGVMNAALIVFNLTHEDPVKREIYNNRDFRVGLSHALDRDEMIAAAFQRQGEPWQCAPRPGSDLYDEEMAKQFTEYDPDKAAHHLDAAGFQDRDSQGFRLGPDGKRIVLTMEYATGFKPTWPDVLGLVQGYWKDVGIDVNVKPESRSLFLERNQANKSDVIVWHGDGGVRPTLVPDWYLPNPAYLVYANRWTAWYASEGEEGEEPPERVRRQMELYDAVGATADAQEQAELMREILQIAKEEFWIIGTVLSPPSYGIKQQSFRNVPETIMDPAKIASPLDSPQFFIDA